MTTPIRLQTKLRSITPDELRAQLADPDAKGNMEEFLRRASTVMTKEEAEDFARRVEESMKFADGPMEDPT